MVSGAIYMIYNTKADHKRENPCYIGSSIHPHIRYAQHLKMLRSGKHHSPYLQAAFDYYGESAFKFRILERVKDERKLCSREQHWIDHSKPAYNYTLIARRPAPHVAKKRAHGFVYYAVFFWKR